MPENQSSIAYPKSKLFKIHNAGSSFNQYYHMTSPFGAVIETYRSDLEKPYFKIVNFSPDDLSQSLLDDENFLADLKKRPLHQHDFFEFMFVLQGEAIVKIENAERVYPAGTGCIVNCNLRHVEELSNDFRLFFLSLSKEYVQFLLHSCNSFHFDIEKSAASNKVLHFLSENASHNGGTKKEYLDFFPVFHSNDSYKTVYYLEEKIIQTILSPQAGTSFFINGLIFQLFDVLSTDEYFHTSTVDIDYGNDFLLFTKLTHLLEDSDGQLARHELSDLLNYSGDYLNRISKKYTGMTLFEYGMTFCMRKAEYYLLKTDYPISQIIPLLGFTNRSHFYDMFRTKYNMTPKEYRLKHRS